MQVSSYGSSDERCTTSGQLLNDVDVRCHDAAGAPADTQFSVMMVKPVMVPEPAVASMLACGAALLAGLARIRRIGGTATRVCRRR